MLIKVMRFKGRAPDVITEADFSRAGGTIGRSSQCTLALPDPERHISRIQAEINWTGGEFVLTDRGNGNPTLCNGEAVGKGNSVPLTDGDELHCGDYVLRIESESGQRREAPADPLSHSFDPFANLVSAENESPQMPSDHPLASSRQTDSLIPDDFDPYGKSCLIPGILGVEPSPGTSSRGRQMPAEESIDALFGLDDSLADPLNPGGALGMPASQPNTSSSSDPFLALQSPARSPGAAMPDAIPEIHSAMPLPGEQDKGRNVFRSWENLDGIGTAAVADNMGRPGRLAPDPEARASSQQAYTATPRDRNYPDPDAGKVSPQVPADALLAALLAGAGLKEAPQDLLTGKQLEMDEATMRRIGSLLRHFSQGVIDLLATRTTLKREMHAAVTVIASQNNNPLKFSPEATSALAYLLAASTPKGFMKPDVAVIDAMNDLRAHQFGVIAGMRAALDGVIERFQPGRLETRLSPPSRLGALMPMNRKARLWEQFEALFNEVSKEAEDHFDALFSDAFVRSYEEQIRALDEELPHQPKR